MDRQTDSTNCSNNSRDRGNVSTANELVFLLDKLLRHEGITQDGDAQLINILAEALG